MSIDELLDQIHLLPESSKTLFVEHFVEKKVRKGDLILKAEYTEKHIYFIKKGIVRAYSPMPNQDITFYFGEEGDVIISMNSYVTKNKGYENIEALENCTLYELSSDILDQLYQQDIHIANWGRKFAERELLKTEQRFIDRLIGTSTERYLKFMKNHPTLLQRVALGYIASYLGITQVSLSRIRSEIK